MIKQQFHAYAIPGVISNRKQVFSRGYVNATQIIRLDIYKTKNVRNFAKEIDFV